MPRLGSAMYPLYAQQLAPGQRAGMCPGPQFPGAQSHLGAVPEQDDQSNGRTGP